jgi:hypothetical protein
MSYDGIMTEEGRALAKQFLVGTRCLYGCDESGRIKDISARAPSACWPRVPSRPTAAS